MTEPIGRRLRALRKAVGLNQAQVAARIHVTRSTIANWEIGHRQPTFESVETYVRAIGMQLHIGPITPVHTDTSSKEA